VNPVKEIWEFSNSWETQGEKYPQIRLTMSKLQKYSEIVIIGG
jgi:hypothetical protein